MLFLVLLLSLNIGIRFILKPHRPVITVRQSTQPEITGRIDLNTASEEELALLPGIGPVRARQIIEYREQHGSFTSKDELMNIRGLGRKTLDSIAGMIRVQQ
jgi:competence protein ComEA